MQQSAEHRQHGCGVVEVLPEGSSCLSHSMVGMFFFFMYASIGEELSQVQVCRKKLSPLGATPQEKGHKGHSMGDSSSAGRQQAWESPPSCPCRTA